MKLFVLGAASVVALATAGTASAQEYRFPAVRADAQIGADRFYSEGNNKTKLGYGGSVGADFLVGTNFVLGAEGTFFQSRAENVTRDGPGVAFRKSFEEWGGALRAGVLISPATLFYVKGGLVVNEQRKYFNADPAPTPGIPVNTAVGDYYNKYRTRGWTAGAGVEQLLSDNFYVKAEGRYSNYRTNSSRIVGVVGVGLRFGPSGVPVAEPLPPAPVVEAAPPPPPPATQTCPDGSVILATDACPVAAPPPPPPPPAPERG